MSPSRSNRSNSRSKSSSPKRRLRQFIIESLETRMLLAADIDWGSSLSLPQLQDSKFSINDKSALLHYSYEGAQQNMVVLSDRLALDLTTTAEQDISKLNAFGLTLSRPLDNDFSVFTTAQPVTDSYLSSLDASGLIAKSVPVFGMLTSKSEAVLLNEVIVALPNSSMAETYFSDTRFSGYRRLDGTPDQFVGTLKNAYGADALELINELGSEQGAVWVAPNYYQAWQKFYTPNDPRFGNEWHLHNTGQGGGQADIDSNLPEAWDVMRGGSSTIVVGVVDDGVATNHADILPWVNTGEIPGDSVDNDNNGWVDDINGWNFVTNNNVSIPDTANDMHGTAVSGVAAAVGDNNEGVVGPAYKSPVLSARIFRDNAVASDANIAGAVYYAAGRTANGLGTFSASSIVNHSWGGGGVSAAITAAFTWATSQGRGGLGAPQLVATGNGFGAVSFPANLSPTNTGLIAIGAINNQGTKSDYSNFGPQVDVVTGSNDTRAGFLAIDTTDRIGADGYAAGDYTGTGATGFGGTSSATPLATGVGALTLARAEQLGVTITAADLKKMFRNNTKLVGPDLFDFPLARNDKLGYGLLDASTIVSGVGKAHISVISKSSVIGFGGQYNLGQSVVGGTYDAVLKIRNQGTQPLNLGSISVSGAEFSIYQSPTGSTLQVGESIALTVRLKPTSVGAKIGFVSVSSNDSATPVMLFSIISTSVSSNVSGYFYEDFNGDTQYSDDELGLANQVVILDANNNGIADYTNFTQSTSLTIVDNTTVTSNLNVTGFAGVPTDVNVTINATHTWVSDLVIELVAPSGTRVRLIDSRGGSGDNLTNTVFDDQASNSIATGVAPFTGVFQPESPLSVLNGVSPNGNWRLEVTDTATGDVGQILNWSLSMTNELAFSDSNGFYYFRNVPSASYTDLSITPSGYVASGPTQYPITITAPTDSFLNRNFGVGRNNRVYAYVFEDFNRDGVRTPDEHGLANRTLQYDGVVNTSYNFNGSVPIVDLGTVEVPIVVPAGSNVIQDVNVAINLTHTWVSDLNISLVAPTGQIIDLSSGNGGSGFNYTNTVFDDSAANSITTGSAPFTGTFRPEQSLNVLNGLSPTGTWRLRLTDTVSGDAGTVLSWSVIIASASSGATIQTGPTGWAAIPVTPGITNVSLINVPGWIYTAPVTGSITLLPTGTPVFDRTFGTRPINYAPTIDILNDQLVIEDSGSHFVDLTGITAGRGDNESVRISLSSDSTASITSPLVIYNFPDTTGTILFDTVPDQSGQTVITVTVEDAGPDNDFSTVADNATTVRSFTVTVLPVNDAPLIDPLSDMIIAEDAPLQTVALSGIDAGGGESQSLMVTATSSNVGIIPNPTVIYSSPLSTGSLTFTPIANTSGSVTITVTLTDAGLDNVFGTGDELTAVTSFIVVVTPVNDLPTLNALPNLAINEDAPPVTVNLSGITAGPLENQPLRVTAFIGNTSLLTSPVVTYTSANATGSIQFAPVLDQFGTTTIVVFVEDGGLDNNLSTILDNGQTSRTFTVTVNPVSDPPTLNPISDITIDEDTLSYVIPVTGISTGGGEIQPMRLIAKSSRPTELTTLTVNYSSPDPTGSIVLNTLPDQNGTFFITVIVEDGGLDGNLSTPVDNLVAQRTFTVTVRPINDNPTMIAPSTMVIDEDSPQQTMDMTGIGAGPNETEPVIASVISSDPLLIPTPTLSYTWPSTTAQMRFTPVANKFGTALVVVRLEDAGPDFRLNTTADNAIMLHTITVTVRPVNDPPTLDVLADVTLPEDSVPQTISLAGIGAGLDELQPLRVTATSSNSTLIPTTVVNYTSPATGGLLIFSPAADQSGTSIISVTVEDGGIDADLSTTSDNTTFVRSFTVTITGVNDLPTIDGLANVSVSEDAVQQTVNLTGIGAGSGETQPLRVTAVSSNTALVANPLVTYATPSATGSLRWTPAANQSGTSVVTVTVEDGGVDQNLLTTADNATVQTAFTITVNAVNDVPTLSPLGNLSISEDAPAQTVSLSGVTAGGGEAQPLRVTAFSNSPGVVSNPTVTYSSPANTGSLSLTPVPNSSGVAVITVFVEDGGLDGNLATPVDNGTTSQLFTVTVAAVNDSPTINPLANQTILEDSSIDIDLQGIGAGGGENQPFQVSVSSSNTALVNPQLFYTSPESFGLIQLTPTAGMAGTSVISIVVEDGGLDGNLLTTADNGSTTQSFTLTVTSVNDSPTIDPVVDVSFDEDGSLVVTMTGITSGIGESQPISIVALAEDDVLVDLQVDYVSPQNTALITLTGSANGFGSSMILVVVTDGGLDNNLATANDNGLTTTTFTVTINEVNDLPTIAPVANATVEEDGQVDLSFTGVSAGANENQNLRVTAVSFDGSLIAAPQVTFSSSDSDGTVSLVPLSDQFGQTVVVLQVEDGGLDNDLSTTADNGTALTSFTLTVTPVNDDPTLDPMSDVSVDEDGSLQLTLTGISSGGSESQPIRITAFSSDLAVVDDPIVTYLTPDQEATIDLSTIQNANGTTEISILVEDAGLDGDLDTTADNGLVMQTFAVNVTPVNDAPSIDSLDDLLIEWNGSTVTVNLTGISGGPGELDDLSILAISSNTSLISNPSITHSGTNSTGQLTFTPTADSFGQATIEVQVEDGGDDGDLLTTGDNLVTSVFFQVDVNAVPVASPERVRTTRNVSTSFDVLTNDDDADGGVAGLEVQIVQALPTSAGSVSVLPDGTISYLPASNYFGVTSFVYVAVDELGSQSDPTTVQIGVGRSAKQNPFINLDVNGSTTITPSDALAVIDILNNPNISKLVENLLDQPNDVDVNGDGRVSPADALLVIDFLNARSEAEGESPATVANPVTNASATAAQLHDSYFADSFEIEQFTKRTRRNS